jgi:hypothetical protein
MIKPRAVRDAECALWAWTAWTCLFGLYQAWAGLNENLGQLNDYAQGLLAIDPHQMVKAFIAIYLVVAVLSGWIILRISAGHPWARSSFAWGFALEVLMAALPPYHFTWEVLTALPDYGLQIYALYLLYTAPGRDWFQKAALA